MRRVLRTSVKVAITLGLLAVLLRGTDLDGVRNAARNAGGLFMAASVAVLLALSLVQASRWQAILKTLGTRIRYRAAWGMVLVGFFFSQLLPTSIGGDVARVWKLRQAGAPISVLLAAFPADATVSVPRALRAFTA